jgi:adenylate kinase
MVAPPGAGKGTQATRLAERFGIDHIASGELLRHEVEVGTDIGREASDYLDRGDLVPDYLLLDMIARRVFPAAAEKGYVLDGYPRTVSQAEAAYDMVSAVEGATLQAVLHLDVGPEESRNRLHARAKSEDRGDDTATTIEHRLAVFSQQTEPLLDYYRDRGILHAVNGEQDPDAVTAEIIDVLERLRLT